MKTEIVQKMCLREEPFPQCQKAQLLRLSYGLCQKALVVLSWSSLGLCHCEEPPRLKHSRVNSGRRSNLFKKIFLFLLLLTLCFTGPLWAQDKDDINGAGIDSRTIFDDKALLEGYTQKYEGESRDTLLAMIADNSVGEYKCTAAVRVFKEKYANEVLSREKPNILRVLIRRLNRSDSPFVQVEIMHALVILDRYQYFDDMVPALIQKMDHYNPVVRNMAYKDLLGITKDSLYPREARIVFETLRKILFLSRNRLQNITTPDEKLRQKLDLLRWAIRILGTQELKRLPPEVINLL